MRELLAAGRRRVLDVWMSRSTEPSPILEEIADLAAGRRVPVRPVDRNRLAAAARTDAPQGVLAHADPLPAVDLDELGRDRGGGPPLVLVLDGVTDPHNLGALLRTAECAGVTGALLRRHRAVHVTPAVAKVAAGAVGHVPIAVVASLPAALSRLASAGVWAVGLDAGAGQSLFELRLGDEPVALVLGTEETGLSRLVRERCDTVVAIPQRGHLGSLNVAAAGAVACYEMARRRTADE